ncbi:hypothetical protein WMY93_025702 [Mugilogobius chulae]
MTNRKDALLGVWAYVLLSFLPQGSLSLELTADVELTQSVLVAGNVTLAVSYSGVTNPVITWRKGLQTVVTWHMNATPPDIDPSMSSVLSVSPSGSLVFKNVTLDYTSSYNVEITKSGHSTAVLNFTLTVYEKFEKVTLSSQPDLAVEGSETFSLQYTMARGKSLVIKAPTRTDKGLYTLTLTNPFSSAFVNTYIVVLYGPDEPVLTLTPDQPFYVSGTSLLLSCKAEGFPNTTVTWMFNGQPLKNTNEGVLNLTNIQTSQDGVYICSVVNEQTNTTRQKNVTVKVYEKPKGSPVCSVRSLANMNLQYECSWPGGTPAAQVSFSGLSNSSKASEHLSVNVTATNSLSGTTVSCTAYHPVHNGTCNVTASPPVPFMPTLAFGVNSEGKIQVTISCLSAAMPASVVSWLKGTEAVSNGPGYSINSTHLTLQDYNISTFLRYNYTCSCRNPLGVQQRQIHLQVHSKSPSPLCRSSRHLRFQPVHKPRGTVVTLTWEVPPTSVVTVIPKARLAQGEPSKVLQAGPGEGLSGSAIAGIAAGIPGGILLLLYRSAHLPLGTPKTMTGLKSKAELASNNIRMAGGLNNYNPDYNRLHQAPSERSMDLPMFVPPPPGALFDAGRTPGLHSASGCDLRGSSNPQHFSASFFSWAAIASLMMYSFMGGGLFCAIVGNILLVVSTATDYWMQYRLSGSFAHQGLWRYCMSGKCYMQTDSIAYWNATRAFMILSAMSCFAGIIAGILSFAHFSAFERFNRSFAAGIMFFVSTLFVLLAMAIYTGVTVNFLGKRFGDWRFSWSYILGWVALLMTFFAGIFYMCAYRMHECRRVAGPR